MLFVLRTKIKFSKIKTNQFLDKKYPVIHFLRLFVPFKNILSCKHFNL